MTRKSHMSESLQRELTCRIDALEVELHDLYEQRRGLVIGASDEGIDNAWCVSCGRNLVHPIDGEDTCWECRASV